MVSEKTHPLAFLLMFAILPAIGFPISVFLILVGLKFGLLAGVLIMFGFMPLHLLIAFVVANSFFRFFIQARLDRMDFRMPQIPSSNQFAYGIVFMVIPGLSYTIKNYALALSGIPFRYFFLSGLIVQGGLGSRCRQPILSR